MAHSPCVVLTREPADNAGLASALRDEGVPVRELPCLSTGWVTPRALPAPPDVLVFTSRRGVEGLTRLDDHRHLLEPEDGPAPLRAAVGPSTAESLASIGFPASRVAVPATGEALARLLNGELTAPSRILILRGNLSAGDLDDTLRDAGHLVEELVLYRNLATELVPEAPFRATAIFVTAPSAARRLLTAMPWMRSLPFLVLGPTTAEALSELGATIIHRARPVPTTWAPTLAAMHRAAPPMLTGLPQPPI